MENDYQLCVIGTSAGGFEALSYIIPNFPKNFFPVVVVIHQSEDANSTIAEYLNDKSVINVKEAESNEMILPGNVYIAPAGYHTLVEADQTLSLSKEAQVNFSRPSIDVLFESAAIAYQKYVIGVLLTGANHDGSQGLLSIQRKSGLTVVQDPTTAEAPIMPQAAIDSMKVDQILPLTALPEYLISLYRKSQNSKI